MANRSVLFALLASAAVAACAPDDEATQEAPRAEAPAATRAAPAPAYEDLTVTELQGMLEHKDFALINVHVPFEGDLPSTDASIPFDQIAQHLDRLPADRNAKIVLYCRSGSMSTQAARTLAGLGYTNVLQLSGGFNAWRAAGLPMAGG